MVTAHASRLATLRHASSTRVDATLAALFDARPAVDERFVHRALVDALE